MQINRERSAGLQAVILDVVADEGQPLSERRFDGLRRLRIRRGTQGDDRFSGKGHIAQSIQPRTARSICGKLIPTGHHPDGAIIATGLHDRAITLDHAFAGLPCGRQVAAVAGQLIYLAHLAPVRVYQVEEGRQIARHQVFGAPRRQQVAAVATHPE